MPYDEVQVIDSHTGGEPTRVVIAGGPDLGAGTIVQRLERFRSQHDRFRSAIVNEPRGSDVMVGGLRCRETADELLNSGELVRVDDVEDAQSLAHRAILRSALTASASST